ncbi:hypothetical protein [Streptomyces canus]|nr:hypothetical protein [Streptomyces canus]
MATRRRLRAVLRTVAFDDVVPVHDTLDHALADGRRGNRTGLDRSS